PDGARAAWIDADLRARVTVVAPEALLEASRRVVGPARSAEATDAGRDAAPGPGGSPRRGEFVGAARCAACHRDAYDAWRASAHATTTALAGEDSVPTLGPEGGRVEHPPGATTFRREDGRLVATTLAEDGAPRDFALTHTVGARRLRMLVATLPDGRRQVLPSMCELPVGPWFDYTHLLFGAPGADPAVPPVVAPGDPSFWTGPVRAFDARCAGCHVSGREPRAAGPDGTGPRSTWRALGVDCEACHGPGRAHAEAWDRLETGAPLPRLETLDRAGKVEACTQCHVEGERLTPHGVVGEDLYEHVEPTLLLDPERVDPYGRPLELVYDGLPFGTSRCAEAGGLTCSRCHAPHGSPRRSLLRPAFDERATCGACHGDVVRDAAAHAHHRAGGAGASCVACHMPFLEIERGHGRVADHTIGVPDPRLPGDRVARDACTACHAAGARTAATTGAPALDGEALRAAYARWWPRAAPHPWQTAIASARTGAAGADALLGPVVADRALPRLVRASAARLLERSGEAARAPLLRASHDPDALVRRAALTALAAFRGPDVDARLRAALDDASRAVRTAAARAALAGWARVEADRALLDATLPVLEADAASVPDDDQRWFRLGAARELAGDVAGAIDAYARQVALDPFAANVRTHLARLRAKAAAPR
ncbi:MAG: HEAT repeat domain-containing protein, partial [Planctomycetia bacterium]|nr:HEAT repeat domain-containing protein [Planctomycetia bacterium]